MWNPLSELIPSAANAYQFKTTLKAIEICNEFNKLLANTWPDISSEDIKAKSYKDLVISVEVSNPAFAQVLQMEKHNLLKKIVEKYGKETVKAIKIEIGQV